jgi:hypothetical protein
VDGVGDGAGEAAALRSPKGFFHHFARFPDSFTGMASMGIFGGKRCYRTSGDDSKRKVDGSSLIAELARLIAAAGSLGCQ